MKKTIIAIVISSVFCPSVSFAETEKPNILFIFADDHEYASVGAYGNKEVKTPNLDRLAASGTRFVNAYNSGAWNGAVCMASRKMMITGKQLWKAHAANVGQMVADKQTFPMLMQEAGYETYFSGKWHVPTRPEHNFNHAVNVRGGMPKQTGTRYGRNWELGKDNWSPADTQYGGFWEGGKHWSEVLADDGENFLKQAAKSNKPFMMMLCFNAPHDPRQAPQEYQDMYPYERISIPANFKPEYPHNIGSNSVRDEKLAPFPRTEHSIRVNRSEYYAIVSHMDTQIGRILEALEKSGKADDTVIIFSADHGLAVGQHGLLGKQNMYEHSVKVPWIIAGKNIPKGKVLSQRIYLQDAMATCLDLGGVQKPEHVDFNSVMPLVNGEKETSYDAIYSCYMQYQKMVVKDDFKLIHYPLINVTKIFDLKNDPMEMNDLAGNREFQNKKAELVKVLEEQKEKMNEPDNLEELLKKSRTPKEKERSKRGGQ